LSELPQPGFPVDFPVGTYQNIKQKPEQGDYDDSKIEVVIFKNLTDMTYKIIVDSMLSVDKKQCPGKKSSQKICQYIFYNLELLVHSVRS
jgi:hypothetical protein